MLKVACLSALCCALFLTLAGSSSADKVAATIQPETGTEGGYPVGGSAHGWEFIPSVDMLVTHLGLYDHVEPFETVPVGLGETQWVGIFAMDETLLVYEWLRPGTQEELLDHFRYAEISPFRLSRNKAYVIAAGGATGNSLTANRHWHDFATPPEFADEIEYVRARFDFHEGRTFPFPRQFRVGEPYRFGPNFQFVVVPEPATVALAILGIVWLTFARQPHTLGHDAGQTDDLT
jgi:hypothetical protein